MSCALLAKIGAVWLTHKYLPWDFYFTKISVIYFFSSEAGEINVQVSRAVSELQGEIKAPAEWAGFTQSRKF